MKEKEDNIDYEDDLECCECGSFLGGLLPSLIPILFSGDMVRAILAGRKTMTRRVVKGLSEKCPYGKIGDVLWVREKFRLGVSVFDEDYYYAADSSPIEIKRFKWKPSIFMPKKACRIFLEIIDIRIERLNDISKSDARKEGISKIRNSLFGDFRYADYLNPLDQWRCPISSFQSLWQKINGMESWEKNPWVWVISFKQVERPSPWK
jgi:hypothetical protein